MFICIRLQLSKIPSRWLDLPEMSVSEDGRYEFIYEVKIFQPGIVQEGEQMILVPGELSRQIDYTLSFTQNEYDSLRDCGIADDLQYQ